MCDKQLLNADVSRYYKLSHLLHNLWETASLNTYDLCRQAITPEEATKKEEEMKEAIFELIFQEDWPAIKARVEELRRSVY